MLCFIAATCRDEALLSQGMATRSGSSSANSTWDFDSMDSADMFSSSSGGGSSSSSGDGSDGSKRPSSPGVTGLTSSGTAAGAAVAAAISADSRAQLAQLQDAQQQLMQELRRSLSPRSTGQGQPTSPGQRLSLMAPAWSSVGMADASSSAAAAAAAAGCDPRAVVVVAASPQLDAANLPQEVSAYVASLAERLMSLQGLTQAISAQVMAKHQEVTALQDGFTKVGLTHQCSAIHSQLSVPLKP